MAEVVAKLKGAPISAQKCRVMAGKIRSLSASKAIELLAFSNKKAADLLKKVLESAVANAENNAGMDIDELKVHSVCIDEGVTMKRWMARAKGRVNHIVKRTCHITVTVKD